MSKETERQLSTEPEATPNLHGKGLWPTALQHGPQGSVKGQQWLRTGSGLAGRRAGSPLCRCGTHSWPEHGYSGAAGRWPLTVSPPSQWLREPLSCLPTAAPWGRREGPLASGHPGPRVAPFLGNGHVEHSLFRISFPVLVPVWPGSQVVWRAGGGHQCLVFS